MPSGWTYTTQTYSSTSTIATLSGDRTGTYVWPTVTTTGATYTIEAWGGVTITASTNSGGWIELGYLDGQIEIEDQQEFRRAYLNQWVCSEESEEDAERRREAHRQYEAERDERTRTRNEATARAEAWLLTLLDDDQKRDYQQNGTFDIIGSHGGRYRIHQGSMGNVEWIAPLTEANEATSSRQNMLCAHPNMRQGWLPHADVAIGQMLALVTDEPEFLRLANVHSGRRPNHEGLRRAA